MNLSLKKKLSLYIGFVIFTISLSSSMFFYLRYTSEIQAHIDDRITFGAKSIERVIDFSKIDELFLPDAENSEYFIKSHEYLGHMRKIFGLKYLFATVVKDEKYIFIFDTANIKSEKDYNPEDATFLQEYEDYPETMDLAFKTGTLQLTKEPYSDKWGTYLSAFYPVKDSSGKVIAIVGADYDIADVLKDKKKAWFALAILLFVIIGVTALVMLTMNKMVFNPIFLFISNMKSAAESLDLSARFSTERKDEIGELSAAFNAFIEKIHSLVTRATVSMQDLVNATAEIANGNESLAQRTTEQASALEEIASTVEQASSSIFNEPITLTGQETLLPKPHPLPKRVMKLLKKP